MTSVLLSPPYRPRKPKRPRLRRLQRQMRLRAPLLPTAIICQEKRQDNPSRVHHSSRRLHRPRPGHLRARHPSHSLLHLNHRSPPQRQVHITRISHTTILLIRMHPTTPLLMRHMVTPSLTLRILNPPHCTQSIRQATIRHCSPIHRSSTLPILLRNRLPRSITSTIFQVMRR